MINRSNILQFIIAYMDITVDTPTGYLNEQTHMKLKRCNSTKHRWMMDNGINSGTRYTYATWCFFVKTLVLKNFLRYIYIIIVTHTVRSNPWLRNVLAGNLRM